MTGREGRAIGLCLGAFGERAMRNTEWSTEALLAMAYGMLRRAQEAAPEELAWLEDNRTMEVVRERIEDTRDKRHLPA